MTRARSKPTERVLASELEPGDLLVFSKDNLSRLLVTGIEIDDDEVRVITGGIVSGRVESVHRGLIPCPRDTVYFVREVRNKPEGVTS